MCHCDWLWLLWCISVPGSVWGLAADNGRGTCQVMGRPVSGSIYQAGDVVIGGLFPIHVGAPLPEQEFRSIKAKATCTIFNQRSYRWLQTMIFAVQEINRNPALLPNVTLGYLVADTCLAEGTTLGAALAMVTGQEASVGGTDCSLTPGVSSIIGDPRSSASIVVAQTLGPFHFPMVSYFATCTCLSDTRKYPSFFRTVPSDAFQVRGMAMLLRRLGWVFVGLVSGDDDYGKFGVQLLIQELQGSGVCFAYSEVIPKIQSQRRLRQIVDTIRGSSAKVVVTFTIQTDVQALLEEVVRQNVTDKQWIATEAWITYATLTAPKFLPVVTGTIGFALRKGDIPGLGPFLTRLGPDGDNQKSDPFLKEFWEDMFGCSLGLDLKVNTSSMRQCFGSEVISIGKSMYADVTQLRVSYNVYKAVYAIAYAIQDMVACRPGEGPSDGGKCPDIRKLQPSQILFQYLFLFEIVHYLRRVRATTPVNESFHFDQNGDSPASYDIINWHVTPEGTTEYVHVGYFLSSQGSENKFNINMEKVLWGGGSGDKLVDFLSYSDTMGIILSIFSVSGALLTAGAFVTFLYYRHTALVNEIE
ncbi:hypothetical protein DPEC_G00244140 [Dallia pectoralis]|uniref:Uncharacterized protein n=1 Tax=Dallia pectoralis TaxID=75939 RepID=A0ACC2FVL9_DALPE|nr:hypothetical protein DPEC_G00244140 [Dallia pectoralis]